jgi:hypothetical protein
MKISPLAKILKTMKILKTPCTDKKKIKFSSDIRKFRGAVARSFMRKCANI